MSSHTLWNDDILWPLILANLKASVTRMVRLCQMCGKRSRGCKISLAYNDFTPDYTHPSVTVRMPGRVQVRYTPCAVTQAINPGNPTEIMVPIKHCGTCVGHIRKHPAKHWGRPGDDTGTARQCIRCATVLCGGARARSYCARCVHTTGRAPSVRVELHRQQAADRLRGLPAGRDAVCSGCRMHPSHCTCGHFNYDAIADWFLT
jgi:hypothetical protein